MYFDLNEKKNTYNRIFTINTLKWYKIRIFIILFYVLYILSNVFKLTNINN